MKFSLRRKRICPSIQKAFLVTLPSDLFYLTGFSGSTGFLLLLEEGEAILLCDGRYVTQAHQEVDGGVQVVSFANTPWQAVTETLRNKGITECMVENTLAVKAYNSLRENGVTPHEVSSLAEHARMVKDANEISSMEKALAIAEGAFKKVRWLIRPGMRERDIALELDYCMRSQEADIAFPTIVASGARSALPHARASNHTLREGDCVVIDWGARYEGYCSDTTRTSVLGKKTDHRLTQAITVLRDTLLIVQETAREGVVCADVDKRARNHLDKCGWGKYFTHGLGHGVGIDVHEEPRIGPKGTLTLREGMIITIEPGVYLPGVGGARLENMLLVCKDGGRYLNRLPILV